MKKTLIAITVAAALTPAAHTHAATKTWNNASTDFLWNTTSLNWAEAPFLWVAGDEAVFGATGVGSITVDAGGITATNMAFNTAGYTIGGGTIALDTSSITQIVANQSVIINSALNKTGVGGATGNYFNGVVAAGQTLTLNGNLDATALSDMFFQGAGAVAINGSIGSNYRHFQLNSGATTVTFAAANSFTGVIQLFGTGGAQTLNFSDVNQLGTGTGVNHIAVQGGSTLRYTGTGSQATGNRHLYWNVGSATIDITQATGDLKFNITGGDLSSGGGTFTKTGAGTLTLATSGVNVGLGKSILLSQGTLAIQGNGTNLVFFAGSVTGASGTMVKVLAGTGTGFTGNGNFTANWSANLADMDVQSGARFGLRGNDVRVDALTGGGDIYQGINATTQTLTLGVDNGSGVFSGVIHGNNTSGTNDNNERGFLAVTKLGDGTQTLSGVNTYTGATTVSAGTLLINGSLAAGSAVSVASGATLGGNGVIGGSVSIASGGTFAPGNSIDQIDVGSLALSGDLLVEVSGALIDRVDVAGLLDLSAASDSLTISGTLSAPAYIIASYGSLSGTFGTLNNLQGYTVNYAYLGNQIALVNAAQVPAPAALPAGLSLLALAACRRPRRRSA